MWSHYLASRLSTARSFGQKWVSWTQQQNKTALTLRFYSSLAAGTKFFSGFLANLLQSISSITVCGFLQWRQPISTSETALVFKTNWSTAWKTQWIWHCKWGLGIRRIDQRRATSASVPSLKNIHAFHPAAFSYVSCWDKCQDSYLPLIKKSVKLEDIHKMLPPTLRRSQCTSFFTDSTGSSISHKY